MSAPSLPAARVSFSSVFFFFFFFFFSCCFRISAVAAAAELAAPQNVDLVTLNTNYTLCWDWDQSAAESGAVTFTTEYVGRHKLKSRRSPHWYVACNQTSRRSCDLTSFNLHYLGIYVIRVRANLDGRHSDWVQREFCPDKEAALGPPTKVRLSPAGSVLDVFISDPVTSTNASMKEKHPEMYYNIIFWEGPAETQASEVQTLSSTSNLVTLPNLKAWTWYCVTVQSRYDFYNKTSSFTSPLCMQTEGPTSWWLIFLYFLGSLVICFMLVLFGMFGSFRAYKAVKDLFYPSDQLPPHLKEYLCDSPASDVPRLFTPDSESELLCEKEICPQPVLEIHHPPPEVLQAPPSVLEPDSSGRHSRQDSSGSGDSGVYSTGGSGQQQQPGGAQTSAGPEAAPWRGLGSIDPEPVKMRDMAPALKSRPPLADEGVVDMFV